MNSRYQNWQQRLEQIQNQNCWREPKVITKASPTTGIVDGQNVLLACSNDYLGISHLSMPHSESFGATGSRLVSGTSSAHANLEAELEQWFGRPALVFGSGYLANIAVFSTLVSSKDKIASDAENHASIIDGLRLGKAERIVVPHNDPYQISSDVTAIAIESLYSMSGDIAPLTHYPTAPLLLIDESHAIGCLGNEGRGVHVQQGRTPDILIGTFGKALGGYGAFVIGPLECRNILINEARSFIFSTALPPSVVNHARESIRYVRKAEELRAQLAERARQLRHRLQGQGWDVGGQAHILPVIAGDHAGRLSQMLLNQGIFAPPIRWPTVPRGYERIRLTVTAAHSSSDIAQIADGFGEYRQFMELA